MILYIIPQGFRGVSHQIIYILKCPQCQEVRINVILHYLIHNAFPHVAPFQPWQKVCGLQQGKCSIVMAVISPEPVGDRRLGRNSFQCRMIGGSSHGGIETIITDAPCTYVPIIMSIV